ncbi:bifunctional epoxide hydrolase 2 [Suncus etruscus]|uniref:bifunctional epoxide hydrolase 2 n=1 Tax=Suncus etruscus TaxID=109475 RepID=UPI00210FA111|nr:bifunctional epoxide hydrolase 2 [Suncus etruscus]
MALRAVIFDLDGVLALPSFAGALTSTEEALALPRGFLMEVFLNKGISGSGARLLRGEITFSQFISVLEDAYMKYHQASGSRSPRTISKIMSKVLSERTINSRMLQAALSLRRQGLVTGILTNNWLDDSPYRHSLAQLMCSLRPHFDLLVESCQVGMLKPQPQIYQHVLDSLKANPKEVVFLDDMELNLMPARELGMATILASDTDSALKELESITGIQLLHMASPLPASCHPDHVSHGYVSIRPGIRLHYVEMGSGPPVCLCHGFPESWFSWRYQIPALAQAGFRVIAVDMKGYGDSSAPHEIEEYSMEMLCKDMVTFLDKMGLVQATFIGHDWGGVLVWNLALFYPERVSAVASLNTPFAPAKPDVDPMKKIEANPMFDYQLYFQEPGVAEAELEKDLNRTFRSFFRAFDEPLLAMNKVRKSGGLFVKVPQKPSLSRIMTEEDIQFYVQQFKKSGFRGPLNWYRNINANWKWGCKASDRKILIPALMVTAEKDFVLPPEMSKHMEKWIPNLKGGPVKDCGHWTQMEQPAEVNQILTQWLQAEARPAYTNSSKL